MALSLRYSGTTQTLTQWGVQAATLTRNNGAVGTLEITLHAANITSAPVFAADGIVELLDANGTRQFYGRVLAPKTGRNRQRDTRHYTVAGLWWWLDALSYEQTRTVLASDDGSAATTTDTSPRVALFNGLTAAQEAAEALAIAIGAGAPLAVGTLDLAGIVPLEERRSCTVAQTLQAATRFRPEVAWWIDDTPTTPTIHAGLATARTVALDALTTIREFDLAPRPDLVPSGVVFTFELPITSTDGVVRNYEYRFVGGACTDPFRILTRHYSLAAGASIPLDLASGFYSAVARLHYQGQLAYKGLDFTWQPGAQANFTGGQSAWTTAAAIAQSVSFDLAAETTTVSFGPPGQLTPTDNLADTYARILTTGSPTDYAATQGTGAASLPIAVREAIAAKVATTAGDVPAQADTLTQRIQDKLGSFALQAGSGFQMATMDVTATVHGFAEYISSTPPRAYKRHRATGSGAVLKDGEPNNVWSYTGTGVIVTISNTGSVSASGESRWVGTSGIYGYGYFADHQQAEYADYAFAGGTPLTYTETFDATHRWKTDNGGSVESYGHIYSNQPGSQVTNTISEEDTDADARARAQATASWSAWTAFASALNGAAAWQTVRTTGWSSSAHLAKIKATTLRSNIWGYPGRVSIPIYRYAIGATQPSAPTSTQTFDIFFVDTLENIAAEGEAAVWQHVGVASMPEWELPCEQGFVNLAGSPTVSLL